MPARFAPRTLARWLLAIATVVSVFGSPVLLLRYFGGARLLSNEPLSGYDFDTHASQAWRVLEGLQGWGKTWVYDVQHLAGYPNGTIFDADNKGWEIFIWALVSVGVPQGLAFNLFVVATHLLVAPVVYASARLFGLRHLSSLLGATLAVLYWYFDSWNHWEWYVGMIAYAFASYLFLLPLACFYRWIHGRRRGQAVCTAASMGLVHLVHPYSFFLLVAPMAALYVAHARTLGRRGHATVLGIAGFTVLANAWWLAVAFAFWHYILDSSLFGHTTIATVAWDLLGLVGDPAVQGVLGTRSGFRMLLFVAGGAGVWGWFRRRDPRALPIGVGMAFLAALAYLGGYTFFANIQPYRHVGPLGFLAILPAMGLLELAVRERVWTRTPPVARALGLVLAVGAAQHLARDVLYFTARSLPPPAPLTHGWRVSFTRLGYEPHGDYSYRGWEEDELVAWVRAHDDGTGRFLVEGWYWGEWLTWKTEAQILGGFIWRNLEHSWANFFRRRPQGIARPEEMRSYLETYAVKWVIVSAPAHRAPWWDKNPLLEKVASFSRFRIYRTRIDASLFAAGAGTIEADTNRIGVSGTDPRADLVLRYHWLETLACEPECRLEQEPVEGDRVGFIRVPAPHPVDFEIRNTYRRVADPLSP